MPLLRLPTHHVLGLLHADDATTVVDGTREEGVEGGQELGSILSTSRQTDEPLPGQRSHLLEHLFLAVARQMPEEDATVRFDPGQQIEKALVQFSKGGT